MTFKSDIDITEWDDELSDDYITLRKSDYLAMLTKYQELLSVNKSETEELLLLDCLFKCGVEKWEGYTDALELQEMLTAKK